ncbi:MAG: ABC transporter ATP-binding protein [Candidatus Thorarchaeota archaeon]|nr:ABC transporter ATP-binding protein [Candidatus Thorarchaeota archaeon]
MPYAVELENISKSFPGGVQANKNITLQIKEGEVHGLLGENGAGKSTLMNVLYGLLGKDAGRIVIRGEEVTLRSPEDAISRGVGMVHQHFKLIPTLTVTENVMLGAEPSASKIGKDSLFILVILAFSVIVFAGYFHGILTSMILLGVIILLILISLRMNAWLSNVHNRIISKQKTSSGLKARIWGAIASTILAIKAIFLSLRPLGYDEARKKIMEVAKANGMEIDPDAKVQDISVGLQQRVEIIKALYRNAEILILDEPTSVLTPQEVDDLFETLKQFRDSGKTIILITHKLRETMALCDRISVLRDGELVGTVNKTDTTPEELAQMMVGRPFVFGLEKEPARPGDVVLSVEDLVVKDIRGVTMVKGVSFEVRAGEILGIAGVEGNGQTELVEAITGLTKVDKGKITIDGVDITQADSRAVKEARVAHIPEDRQKRGLILAFSVEENMALGAHYREPFANKWGVLQPFEFRRNAIALVDKYSVKVTDVADPASTLSGGNQQKVVVARELSSDPRIVIAAQPTRGLDVGATQYIHNVLLALRDSGVAVLLVSAELDEIRALSDRIAVIFDGQIIASRDSTSATAQELGLLMAGHSVEEATT